MDNFFTQILIYVFIKLFRLLHTSSEVPPWDMSDPCLGIIDLDYNLYQSMCYEIKGPLTGSQWWLMCSIKKDTNGELE